MREREEGGGDPREDGEDVEVVDRIHLCDAGCGPSIITGLYYVLLLCIIYYVSSTSLIL